MGGGGRVSTFRIDYEGLWFHQWMLADETRTDAFRRALAASVRPGDVVLDVGAGTAILGILAAQAGARKVYAVEPSGIAAVAERLVRDNGLAGRVEVIRADAEAAVLPEKVDVIVAEVWGYIGVDENLLAKLLVCRDRWLKPGGKMLPQTITSWTAPVEDEYLTGGLDHWRARPYGVDLSAIADLGADEVQVGQHHVTGASLLAEAQRAWTVDARTMPVEAARRPLEATLRFVTSRAGIVSGLAGWFDMVFPDGTTLGNGPDDPPTHWGRQVLPLRRGVEVPAGTPIEATVACEPVEIGVCRQRWSVRVGDGAAELHGG
jgi:SAM-dependent methyltransferase